MAEETKTRKQFIIDTLSSIPDVIFEEAYSIECGKNRPRPYFQMHFSSDVLKVPRKSYGVDDNYLNLCFDDFDVCMTE